MESGEHRIRAIESDDLWTLTWESVLGKWHSVAAPTLAELLSFAATIRPELDN